MASKTWHEPATADYRESWATLNPRGVVIYFGTEQDALDAADAWAQVR